MSNSIVHKVLDWTEKKENNLDPDDKFVYAKAFGLGAIEGAIDSAVFWYPILLAGCYYWKKKST